jgi:two-component system, cell cycle response regulator DivK
MADDQQLTTTADNPDPGQCVLIVDDDALNLKLFATSLTRRGYRVLLAMDGRRGIDLACRERPDLIMMDVQLPDMSGLEATRTLKSNDDTRDIPVMITTAFLIDSEELRKSGCDGFLAKPFSAPQLMSLMASLMQAPASPSNAVQTAPARLNLEGIASSLRSSQ